MTTRSRIPIILDVDTGLDDALALVLALRNDEVDLQAVTTVAGNVNIWKSTANTLAVLDHLGAATPVYQGASRPLVEPVFDASDIHGVTGLGDARLPESSRTVESLKGPAAIVQRAKAQPGELTLVCTGPLTNLAIALNVEPGLPNLLKQVVVMGGAYRTPGNTRPWAEFNMLLDPDAAEQVFSAGFPDIIAIGLDVTHPTTITRSQWERLSGHHQPEAALVGEIIRYTFVERGRDIFYLHDPLALGVAIDPTLVTYETGRIEVVTTGSERGRTVFLPGEGATKVGFGVDVNRFRSMFGQAIGVDLGD